MNPNGPFAFLLAMVLAIFCRVPAAIAADGEVLQYGEPIELGRLEDRDVSESSGLAVSRRDPRLFWTHNDSGGKPRLYCFDVRGKQRGTCKLKKAGAIDWEDMCSFVIDGKPKLLVGDVGDNQARRRSVRLYLLDEPEDPRDDVSDYRIIKLRYSTGPTDCEAIGVDPVTRKLVLVEKKWRLSCRAFVAPYPEEGVVEVTAKPVARISLPLVTALDISPDGRRALVLTLGEAFEFGRGPQETWQQAFARKPRKIHMPPRKQGETVCYDTLGRDIYLTSEGRPAPLFRVPVKGS